MLDRSIFRSRSIFGGRSIFPGRAKQTAFGTKLSVALFGTVAPGTRILDSAIGLDRVFLLERSTGPLSLAALTFTGDVIWRVATARAGGSRIEYSPQHDIVLARTNDWYPEGRRGDDGTLAWTVDPGAYGGRGGGVDPGSGDFFIAHYASDELWRYDSLGQVVYTRWQGFPGPNALATAPDDSGDYYVHASNDRLYRGRISDGAMIASVSTPARPISPILYGGFAAGPFNVVYVDENKWIRCYSRDLNVLWAAHDAEIQVVNDIAIDKYGDIYLAGLRNSAPLLRRYNGMSGALVLDLEVESTQPHSRALTSVHVTDDGRVMTTTDNGGGSSPASEYRILVQS